jgi:hypothetical protein
VATSAPLAAEPGGLYLAAISSKPYRPVDAVSGLGGRWTLLRAQCAGRNQTGVEVWMGQGIAASGIVTARFATAPLNAVIAACRFSGADAAGAIGSLVSGNTNGVAGACTGGVDGATYSFDLPSSPGGGLVFGAVAMRNKTLTPGQGYTQRAEVRQGTSGDEVSLAVLDRPPAAGSVLLDGRFSSSVDWAVIGLEIRPASVASKLSPRTEVPDEAERARAPELWIGPNPARSVTVVAYELQATAAVRVAIHDVTGRRIRTLVQGAQPAGPRRLLWDGRDEAGNPVPSGVYFVQLELGARKVSRKIALQR